ncbi:adenylate/guanylate cyclase domain-containing protein [Pleurocapsales cyanobacterium LEGE 06147]|nr:adenylate/guanylate cyclase domain-containing protein [Pleurocapsales cyanobacterium LEGE 06147]
MQQFIFQAYRWFVGFLLKQIILALTILLCVGAGITWAAVDGLSLELMQSQALQNAEWCIKALKEATQLYSDDVVERVEKIHGITVTDNYPAIEGAIPIPSTYSIVLGKRLSEQKGNLLFRVYSDYPFPARQADGTGGPQDRFEQDALDYLRQSPNDYYYRIEKYRGRLSMRYVMPSIMKASCVACHNTHPNSPKKDWRVGDVRGAWELIQPLDNFMKQNEKGLMELSVQLGGLSILGLLGLILVIGRLRQATRELEGKVRERTAELAQANIDLEQRNGLIRQVFGRYLSDEVVTNLLTDAENEKLQLGGERRKITILTSDLRGFTAISERMSPEEVIQILNIYLEYMADAIAQYQGTIDEFMGDGILVLFGAPTAREDDAVRAVACACAMQLAMGSVNERMKQMGLPPLEMGIGINTGEVVVGNIGSEKRTKYGIVGSPVNLTYRIESYTTGGQILISETTLQEVGSIVKIAGQRQVRVKGVKEAIAIYEVWGIGGFYNLFLPREEEQFFPLVVGIPLQYTILDDKHVSNTLFKGSLVELSAKGAKVRIHQIKDGSKPSPLSNLKVNFLTSNEQPTASENIYAKVLEKAADNTSFYISFTSKTPEIEARLGKIYKWIARKKLTHRLEQD